MSSLQVGIVGFPNAGKTTLFNALSRAGAHVASYPFTTVEPNVGVIAVPDPRLEKVADLAGCERRVPSSVRFVDIAGLVEGASKGAGLGNRFLADIREVDAVVHVVRAFEAPDVPPATGSVDPVHDVELIETELRLADLEVLRRMISKAKRDAKSGDGDCKARLDGLIEVEEMLGGGPISEREKVLVKVEGFAADAGLISVKPEIIILNVGEDGPDEPLEARMRVWAGERGLPVLVVNAEIEAELAELEPEEAAEFEAEMGIEEESLERLVHSSYEMLGLITFFSIDSGECRAWPIPVGSHADHAAGRIHSDFEKGFIKAEVVHYDDFITSGDFHAARDKGALRIEGRDYVVQDGDVMHFKFAT
ncbi:MAG: redox-regulated ATPase YchF [Actinobacteria bacterium]|nr:redox-regulated ATPase YchF [Actinomycetota bacterium]